MTSFPAPFGVSVHPTGTDGIIRLRVVGEIDLLTVPSLVRALDEVLSRRHRATIVDLTAVTFCSVRGCQALIDAQRRARHSRTAMIVLGRSPATTRLLSLGWPEVDG